MDKRDKRSTAGCLFVVVLLFVVFGGLISLVTTETTKGKCIGLSDWEGRDTTKHYRVNTTNVIVGLTLVETVIVPAYILLEAGACPND